VATPDQWSVYTASTEVQDIKSQKELAIPQEETGPTKSEMCIGQNIMVLPHNVVTGMTESVMNGSYRAILSSQK